MEETTMEVKSLYILRRELNKSGMMRDEEVENIDRGGDMK